MAFQATRTFSLLILISLCILFLILAWEGSVKPFRRIFTNGNRLYEHDFTLSGKKGNSTPHQEKITSSAKPNPVTTPKITKEAAAETPMPILSKKSFNKLPKWDFDDVYNQDAPPRQTTCAQSLRNSKDESFKKTFLPNIRLYLHKDNINMSEWNRLSHFNNPFGFMEYKYEEAMPPLKLIPKPTKPLLVPKPGGDGCVHCAVVGTAGILNGSKVGAEIDSHDYIFRQMASDYIQVLHDAEFAVESVTGVTVPGDMLHGWFKDVLSESCRRCLSTMSTVCRRQWRQSGWFRVQIGSFEF